MTTDSRGYILPENYDPPDVVCVKVYIPNDPLYLREFWGAYSYFTQWSAWKRDPLKRGKIAAKRWLDAYATAREEYILYGGCPVSITNLRQNPLDPCKLEFSEDGVTWTQFANVKDCGGGCNESGILRFNGTTVQRYDPCAQLWIDAGPPIDMGESAPATPQYVGDPNGNCLAGANASALVDQKIGQFIQTMIDGLLVSEIIGVMGAGLSLLVPLANWVSVVLTEIEVLSAYSSSLWNEINSVDILDALKCIMVQEFTVDGDMTAAQFASVVNQITIERNKYLVTSKEYSRWDMTRILVVALGKAGLINASKAAGILDADCEDCGWSQVFDFDINSQGWYAGTDGGATWGQYVNSEYWRDSINDENPFTRIRRMDAVKTFPPTVLTSVYVSYDVIALGVNDNGCPIDIRTDGGTMATQNVAVGNDQFILWEGTQGSQNVDIRAIIGYQSGSADPGGEIHVKRVIVKGTGNNPFV